MITFCDAHVHFIPQEISVHTDFYKGVWTDKEKLYAFLDKQQIKKALVVYPSTDAHIKLGDMGKVCGMYNLTLARMMQENHAIIAAGIVDISRVDTLPEQVAILHSQGFRAVSLASSYDGKFLVKELAPLFEKVASFKMPIFVHPQTINPIGFERVKDPLLMPVLEYSFDSAMYLGLLMMEGVLAQAEVTFIFASLAGVLPFLKERFDRVYEMLRTRGLVKDLGNAPTALLRRVYVDVAGASVKNIEAAIDLFGVDHLLWGSDYPVNANVTETMAMLDSLGQEVKRKIVSENFLRLFSK